jgi:hypothetical protein
VSAVELAITVVVCMFAGMLVGAAIAYGAIKAITRR